MLRRMLRLRRRPEEDHIAYNLRTAGVIQKWCQRCNVTMVFVRVIKAVYKAAWKDKTFALDDGSSPLRAARQFRNAMWWQTVQVVQPKAKRQKLGIVHHSRGQQRVGWEHPFVAVWGCTWQDKLDACSSLRVRMQGFPDFVKNLCGRWQIPYTYEPPDETDPGRWVSTEFPTCVDDLPYFPPNSKEAGWDCVGRRVWVQTDNQQLQQIFAGLSVLESPSLRPPCVRVARLLKSMANGGFKPRRDISDFIEWDPRELNSVADFAANMALNLGRDWEKRDPIAIADAKASNAHFRLCSDGALRGSGKGSAGIAFYAYKDGAKTLLLVAGKVLGELQSAFVAELLAMEWCLNSFRLL